MTRDEILTRYRHLRSISGKHHAAAFSFLPRTAVLDYARRLGLAFGKTIVADSEGDLALAFDLALYAAKPGRSRAIDRYGKTAPPAPGSDEAAMLDAMRGSHFSIWRVERRHGLAGLVVSDLLRDGAEAWVVDESLERTAPDGAGLGMRLAKPDVFSMTSGIAVPAHREMLERVVMEVTVRGTPAELADNPRFAEAVYQIALAEGLLADPELD